MRELRWIGALVVLATGCGSAVDMMDSLCDTMSDPGNVATGANAGSCTPTRGQVRNDVSCRHRGGKWIHNWMSDYYQNEFWPDESPWNAGGMENWGYGCDADIDGVSFDGIITTGGRKKVFEVKTANYTKALKSCSGLFVADLEWDDVVKSVTAEEPVAVKCGYDYDLVICDAMLATKAMAYFQPPHAVNVVYDNYCINAPPAPDSYTSIKIFYDGGMILDASTADAQERSDAR